MVEQIVVGLEFHIPEAGLFDNRPIPPEAVYYAMRMDDSRIIVDPTAIMHTDIILKFNLDFDHIESGGFLTSGGYAPTSEDVPRLKAIGIANWNNIKSHTSDPKKARDEIREIFF